MGGNDAHRGAHRASCEFRTAWVLARRSGIRPGGRCARAPAPPAVEQPLPVPTGWTVRLTPYVWAPSLNGTQTVRGRTVDVDISFYDLARKIS